MLRNLYDLRCKYASDGMVYSSSIEVSVESARAQNGGSPNLGQSASALRADGAVFSAAWSLASGPLLQKITKHVRLCASSGIACTKEQMQDIMKGINVSGD